MIDYFSAFDNTSTNYQMPDIKPDSTTNTTTWPVLSDFMQTASSVASTIGNWSDQVRYTAQQLAAIRDGARPAYDQGIRDAIPIQAPSSFGGRLWANASDTEKAFLALGAAALGVSVYQAVK